MNRGSSLSVDCFKKHVVAYSGLQVKDAPCIHSYHHMIIQDIISASPKISTDRRSDVDARENDPEV